MRTTSADNRQLTGSVGGSRGRVAYQGFQDCEFETQWPLAQRSKEALLSVKVAVLPAQVAFIVLNINGIILPCPRGHRRTMMVSGHRFESRSSWWCFPLPGSAARTRASSATRSSLFAGFFESRPLGWKKDQCNLFCSTRLPLASTRLPLANTRLPLASTGWVRSSFESHCSLSSKQRRWLTSATSTIFSSENFLGTLGIKPGAAGLEASMINIVLWFPHQCILFLSGGVV